MEIKGTTKITGVFGYPVRHSLSPVFQNAAFKHLGLDYIYIPMEVKPEKLSQAVEGIKALNFAGVNVTIPHKKNIVPLLDNLDENAKKLGVVNTVKNTGGKLTGYSTDGEGFILSLKTEAGYHTENKTAIVLGAGGSSYAVARALIKSGIKKILITNRTEKKAEKLTEHIKTNFEFKNAELVPFSKRNEKKIWQEIELLINTTSVGMKEGDELLVKEPNLKAVSFIYDLVYNRKSELIKKAEKLKIPHLGGLFMLVYQGAVSFEIWTGKKAPVEAMKNSLL
jgi:shikimate dehydrogenase